VLWARGRHGSMAIRAREWHQVDNVTSSGRTTLLRAWGQRLCGRRHHQLGSGKMEARKGARPLSGTMAQRLRGGVDDGVEALGGTRRWHGLQGGRRWHRL
jgi:hypothetical protein